MCSNLTNSVFEKFCPYLSNTEPLYEYESCARFIHNKFSIEFDKSGDTLVKSLIVFPGETDISPSAKVHLLYVWISKI